MSRSRGPLPRLKRRYPRLTLRVDVVLETPAGRSEAVATTLGAGGLFVAGHAPLPPGTPLVVHFRLPGDATLLRFEARVAWCGQGSNGVASPGMGVEFKHSAARAELAERLESWAELR